MCVGWVWYLAIDMQLFVLTPPIIYLYCKKRALGYLSVVLMMMINFAYVVGIVYDKNISFSLILGFFFPGDGPTEDYLYVKTYARMAAYFVGVLFAYFYFEFKNRDKYVELSRSIGA